MTSANASKAAATASENKLLRELNRIHRMSPAQEYELRKAMYDLKNTLNGPFQPGHSFSPPAPVKPQGSSPEKLVYKSPPESAIKRPVPMGPDDYDLKRTLEHLKPSDRRRFSRLLQQVRKYGPSVLKLAKVVKFLNPLRHYFDLLDILDQESRKWSRDSKMPGKIPHPGNGWQLVTWCPTNGPATEGSASQIISSMKCIRNQGWGNPRGYFAPIPSEYWLNNYTYWNSHGWESGVVRVDHVASWWRPKVTLNPNLGFMPFSRYQPLLPRFMDMPNPNRVRHNPPGRWVDPNQVNREAAEQSRRDAAKAAAYASQVPYYAIEFSTAGGGGSFVPHTPKTPPEEGTHERKMLSRAAKIGIFLFKVLDEVSEASEIIDAFYDALPYEYQTCPKKGRGLADAAGQYGIDGADCKGMALYNHWDKVNMTEALKNVFKNYVSDKIIGGYQKHMPKNLGNAASDGEKLIAKWIDDTLDAFLGTLPVL